MNEKDFTKIISETKTIVLSSIQKNLFEENKEYIDDVVQETYLRAFKALSKNQFRGDSKISSWLFQIARNESIRMNQKLNRQNLKNKKIIDSIKENQKKNLLSSKKNLFNITIKFIEKLPNIYKSVILKQLDGKTEKEIALELEISNGTVKSRLFRSKEILKKWISE